MQDGERLAAQHWRWTAPFLTRDPGSRRDPVVRVSRDKGRTYPRTTRRAVTRELPDRPAALEIYDRGYTRVFVADFDAKGHGADVVAREADAFAARVARAGGRTITDVSPTGGRHVYVPLAEPAPWALCRRLAQALERVYRTFDKAPMSGQTDGLIRPPGSPHPAGGFQVLLTDRDDVVSALTRRTSPAAFAKLALAVGVDPEAPTPEIALVSGENAWLEAVTAPALHGRRRRRLSPEWVRMAVTGQRPATWPSDSEARLALLRACARHGWTFSDVAARFESEEWKGLTDLYARYADHHARRALATDWRKALTPDALRPPNLDRESTARRSDTRVPPTHPHPEETPDAHEAIRTWWTVVREVESGRWSGGGALSTRRVLRAVAAAAWRTGSTVIEHGCRSLSEGSGLDHSTVAEKLKQLSQEDDPFLVLVREAEGVRADVYELVVPAAHEELETKRWRAGVIRSVHPVFRHVGGAGFLVWEVLADAGPDPVQVVDIVAETGLPARTVQDTLVQLGELGLAEKHGAGWVAVGALEEGWAPATTLNAVARQIGADVTHAAIMAEHRRDRAAWQARLRLVKEPWVPPDDPVYRDGWDDDPTWYEAERLVADVLGA